MSIRTLAASIAAVASILLNVATAQSQTIELVEDLDTWAGQPGTEFGDAVQLGDTVYYFYYTYNFLNDTLFVKGFDGTNIFPVLKQPATEIGENFVVYNGSIHFSMSVNSQANVYAFDGQSLTQVTSFGPTNGVEVWDVFNGHLYVSASQSALGSEMYRYDGSTVSLVADIAPGSVGSNPFYGTIANGRFWWRARQANGNEYQLYAVDSTLALDTIVMPTQWTDPQDIFEFNGQAWFTGEVAAADGQFHYIDNDTVVVAPYVSENNHAAQQNHITGIYVHNNRIYLSTDLGTSGSVKRQLCHFDGTTRTVLHNQAGQSWTRVRFFEVNSNLYAYGQDNKIFAAIRNDSVVVLHSDIQMQMLGQEIVWNDVLYVPLNDGLHGMELQSFDGNDFNLVEDYTFENVGSTPSYLAPLGDTLYFLADVRNVDSTAFPATATTERWLHTYDGSQIRRTGLNASHMVGVGSVLLFSGWPYSSSSPIYAYHPATGVIDTLAYTINLNSVAQGNRTPDGSTRYYSTGLYGIRVTESTCDTLFDHATQGIQSVSRFTEVSGVLHFYGREAGTYDWYKFENNTITKITNLQIPGNGNAWKFRNDSILFDKVDPAGGYYHILSSAGLDSVPLPAGFRMHAELQGKMLVRSVSASPLVFGWYENGVMDTLPLMSSLSPWPQNHWNYIELENSSYEQSLYFSTLFHFGEDSIVNVDPGFKPAGTAYTAALFQGSAYITAEANSLGYELYRLSEAALRVTGNGTAISNGSTTPAFADSTHLGFVLPGSSVMRTYTLENVAAKDTFNITSAVIVGSGSSDFAVVGSVSATLLPGQSIPVQIQYTPADSTGSSEARVAIVNGADTLYTWAIEGAISEARLKVTQSGGAELQSGDTLHQNISYVQTANFGVQLINNGDRTTYINSLLLAGDTSNLAYNAVDSVQGFDSETLNIHLSYGAIGHKYATLSFGSSVTGFTSFSLVLHTEVRNDPPTAANDFATVLDTAVVVVPHLLNDSDPEGDALTTTIITPPFFGNAIILNADSIQYTPNTGYEGTDRVVYSICDGLGLCDTAEVEITVVLTQGTGLHFDGSNDYVSIDAVAPQMAGLDSFTVEAWVLADPAQSNRDHILAVNAPTGSGHRWLWFLDAGQLGFNADGTNYTFAAPDLRDSTWHHVALRYDGTAFTGFVDGYKVGRIITSHNAMTATDRWSIGQEYDGTSSTSEFWLGSIDEVRIWSDFRTAQEIYDHRYCGLNGTETNLEAWYHFTHGLVLDDNTSFTQLADSTVNAAHGSLVNFGLTGSASNWTRGQQVVPGCAQTLLRTCETDEYESTSGTSYNTTGRYSELVQATSGADSTAWYDLDLNHVEVVQDSVPNDTLCAGDTALYSATTSIVQSMKFDKANEGYVRLDHLSDSIEGGDRSVFMWIRQPTPVAGANQVLFGLNSSSGGNISNMLIDNDEELKLYHGGSSLQSSNVQVTDGLWHNVGFTHLESSNQTKVYVDGVLRKTYTNAQTATADARISLGQEFDSDDASGFYDGYMSQVSIWNTVLPDSMVQLLYTTTPDMSAQGLVAFYPGHGLCGGYREALEDVSGNNLHGIATRADLIQGNHSDTISGYNSTALYDVNWLQNDSIVASGNSLSFAATEGGTHNLQLSFDGNGVDVTEAVNVLVAAPDATILQGDTAWFLPGDSVELSVNSEVGTTYAWFNGGQIATGNSMYASAEGTYTVVATHAAGCSRSDSIYTDTLVVTSLVAMATVNAHVTCNSGSDGGATASTAGGVPPFTYAWSSGQSTAAISNVGAGTYTVTITDATAQVDSATATITEPIAIDGGVAMVKDDCLVGPTGSLTASPTGGSAPYTYQWSNGPGTAAITMLAVGDYALTITDSDGCTAQENHTMLYQCEQAGNLRHMNVQDTSVFITWDTICGATKYKITYKEWGTSNWIIETKEGNIGAYTLTALTPGTRYKWGVRAFCGADDNFGSAAVLQDFTTLDEPCNVPDGLSTGPVQSHQARLNWNQQPTAHKYRLQWREAGGSWTTIVKDSVWNKHWLTGLAGGTTYQWRIKSVCESGVSSGTAWSAVQSFTTPASKWNDEPLLGEDARSLVRIFPNPNNGVFVVELGSTADNHLVQVRDLAGRIIASEQTQGRARVTVNLDRASAGVYLVTINGTNLVLTERVVVQ